jgi:alpha-1,6-mannosyltransferase
MRDALRERARQLGLGARVTFGAYESDRDRLAVGFAQARCAVLPGAHETFGLAALEAAACGTPVVTAATTPSASLLGGAVDTFAAGDSGDLLRAIERARRRAPDLATCHRWEQTFAAELDDLERMLGRSGP